MARLPEALERLVEIASVAEPILARADVIDPELEELIEKFWDSGGPYSRAGWDVLREIVEKVKSLRICANCKHCELRLSRRAIGKVLLYEHIEAPLFYCVKHEKFVNPAEHCDDFKLDKDKAEKTAEAVKLRLTLLEGMPREPAEEE